MYKTAFLDASYTCSVCVLPNLPREFSLIHLQGFLTALPRSDSQLPRLVNAASA